eukprot:85831_1
MNVILISLLILSEITTTCSSRVPLQWELNPTSSSLLKSNFRSFIASYNSSIFIIGGYTETSSSWVEYNTNTQSYTKHNTTFIFGSQVGQSSIQIGNDLYMLQEYSRQFTVINMETLVSSFMFSLYPGYGAHGRCVSYYKQQLFVLGGYDGGGDLYCGSFYILDTINNTWTMGTPLTHPTAYHSCNIVDDVLYVIGGHMRNGNSSIYSDDVFILNLNDTNGTWILLNDKLSNKKDNHRSVVFDAYKEIYVIGGHDVIRNLVLKDVDIINTRNKTIRAGNDLIYGKDQASVIIMDAKIYVFGGYPTFVNHYFQCSSIVTYSPSAAPSNAPTISPTNSPSTNPSNAPSTNPTTAPTRFPTSVTEYNQQINIKYEIHNVLLQNEISLISIKMDIISVIESSYVYCTAQSSYQLQYKQFEITVADDKIDFKETENIITMMSSVLVNDDNTLDAISLATRARSDSSNFINNTEQHLMHYFNTNKTIQFYATIIMDPPKYATFDYVFMSLCTVIVCCAIISLAALLFNIKEGTKVDDAIWISVFLFGLHIFDFYSDVNLTLEVLFKFENGNNNILLYISGIGSILFVLLPYSINILITFKLESLISFNKTALLYLKQHRAIFIAFVLLTGSVHSVLLLLSSRIFGLDFFNCGLVQYEIEQLSHLKIFASVLLENLPQLLFAQCTYIIYLQGIPSQGTILACLASLLSILTTIVSYYMQRRSKDCIMVKYELEIVKNDNTCLLKDENKIIFNKKECKKRLNVQVSAALNIQTTVMQFGVVTVTNNGLIVQMFHYIFKDEINAKQNEHKMIALLYQNKNQQVNQAFSQHFGLDLKLEFKYLQNVELEPIEPTKNGKNAMRMIHKIDALIKENISLDNIETQLVEQGYNKATVSSVLSSFYTDEKEESCEKHSVVDQQKTSSRLIGNKYVLMDD